MYIKVTMKPIKSTKERVTKKISYLCFRKKSEFGFYSGTVHGSRKAGRTFKSSIAPSSSPLHDLLLPSYTQEEVRSYSLDLKCCPKAHVLKAWSPACGFIGVW
jgi:hypothetical protein